MDVLRRFVARKQFALEKNLLPRRKQETQEIRKNPQQGRCAFCLSETELEYYKTIHPQNHLWPVGCNFEMGRIGENHHFALYHGNLSVAENEKSLRWIVDTWAKYEIPLPLVVAGKNPSPALQAFLQKHDFIALKQNPSQSEMNDLIQTAAINLLITFQSTGIKLKLIHALLQGKRCIVNPLMVEGTDLGQFCEVVDDETELKTALLKSTPYTSSQRNERMAYLMKHFDPVVNAKVALEQMEAGLL